MDVTTSFKPNSNKELCVTVTYCRDLIESENPSNVELYVNGSLSNQGMMRNGKASFSILLQPYEQYNISFIVATSNGRIQSKIVTLNGKLAKYIKYEFGNVTIYVFNLYTVYM